MRAAAYARVSSSAQRERDTIASQLRVLPAFITAQGWTLVDTYIDDGHSAKAGMLDARGGFARLVRDADAHRFDVLVVVDIDRLTRTDDLEERARILGPFQRNNIQIVTPAGGALDLRTMLGELYITMQALVAAEDNRKRSERVRQGKLTAAQRGAKVGRGPYGLAYDRASGAWSVDPVRGPIVTEVLERVAAGESCTTIADDLEARGAPAPGARWAKGRVHDLVRSRHTVGEWIAHRRTRTAVSVPTIVTEQLWQRAQDELIRGRSRGLRRTKHAYLLEGLGVCGTCGAPMRIRSASLSRGRYLRTAAYRCARRPGACDSPEVLTADADERAWLAITGIVADRDLPAEIAAVRKERAADGHDWGRDAAGYRAHLTRLDKIAAALLVRFRRGTVSEAELDQELASANRERAAVRAQLAAAERVRGSVATARERLDGAAAMVAALRSSMAAATPEERRAIAMTLIDPGGVAFAGRALRIEMFVDRPAELSDVVHAASCSDVRESRLRIRVVA